MVTREKKSGSDFGNGNIATISDEVPLRLSFPPHVKGPRSQCPTCQNVVGDPPIIEIGSCHHPLENYHVLELDVPGLKPVMTLACQEENCDGRAFCSVKG